MKQILNEKYMKPNYMKRIYEMYMKQNYLKHISIERISNKIV